MANMQIALTHTDSGTPLFEAQTPVAVQLYRRGSPPKCTNIECEAKLQCYAYPEGWVIGIWAEGIHIRVSQADILDIIATATETLMGLGGEAAT